MALNRLTSVAIGVPTIDETAAYYTDFVLTPLGPALRDERRFAITDGGSSCGWLTFDQF